MNPILLSIGMLLVGGIVGYSIRAVIFILRKNSVELSISEKLLHAREQAQKIVDDAHKKQESLFSEIKEKQKIEEVGFKITEDRLVKKESILDNRQRELDDRNKRIEDEIKEIEEKDRLSNELLEERRTILEKMSGYSKQEAFDQLIKEIESEFAEDLNVRMHKLENYLEESLKDRAKDILATTIQRLATPTTTELSMSSVAIPNEDLKGKIIGKEGRNIRAFERFSGVELLVDESPGYIVVSSFDPIRRATAVHALENLIKDGRIQPAKIEEELEKSKLAIHEIIKEKGSQAVFECGIYNLDPRIISILGRLHFRTSYGQNVLQHSIEMAHIAEMLASELGADVYIAKAGALVHDIGKALDHEFEGTHIDIGIKVLRRFNADERIITAMKSHHDDCTHETIEAVIVQTADIISGGRPGARRDTAEAYLKRLKDLENLASRMHGVEKVYAISAGREIRIFVHPENVSDLESKILARNIAVNIENELRYPGQIKVTIIRETRVTDYAR